MTMLKSLTLKRIASLTGVRRARGRLDPLGLVGALVQVASRTATDALPRRTVSLGIEMAKVAVGSSSVAPDPTDWRFKNPAWKENPVLHRLCQGYVAWSRS